MTQPSGAIHDIGYRHYTGQRLPSRDAVRTLAGEGLRGAFGLGRSARSKIMPLLLLTLALIVALTVAIVAAVTDADRLELRPSPFVGAMGPVLAIFVASQAPQLVSRDLRFRTISLYFSRPLRRGEYLVAKGVAMTGAIVVFLALPILLLTTGGLLADVPVRTVAADLGRGLLAAVVAALVYGSIGLLVAAFTPRRGLGVAAIIAVFLVSAGFASALTSIGITDSRPFLEDYAGLLAPGSIVDTVNMWLTQVPLAAGVDVPGTRQGLVYTVAAVIVVLTCAALLHLRYRKVSVT